MSKSEEIEYGEDFVEECDVEKGFAEFYNQQIRPTYLKFEQFRQENHKKIIKRTRLLFLGCTIFVIALMAGYAASFYYDLGDYKKELPRNIDTIVGLIVLVCSAVLAPIYKKFNNQIKGDLFQTIFKFFGDFIYEPKGSEDISLYDPFRILPAFSKEKSKTEDLVFGSYKGVNFSFEEIHLKSERDHRKEIFIGSVLLCKVSKNFKCRTVVRQREKGGFSISKIFRSNSFDGLEKVNLEDVEFEKMFIAYSQDQIEARYLLTTSFMQRLKELSNFLGSSKTDISFYNGELLLLFKDSVNLFEPESIAKKMNLVAECKKIIEQMHLIYGLIDSLKLDQKTGL